MNNTLNQTINQTINHTSTHVPTLLGFTFPITSSPIIDIYLITLASALFTTLVNKYLSDQARIKALRAEMKELQAKMKQIMQKDPQKAKELQSQIMKKNLENMKHSMNPKIMLVTMVPLLFLFMFVRIYYSQFGQFFNVFGIFHFGWFGTYVTFSIINSLVLKKVLDVA